MSGNEQASHTHTSERNENYCVREWNNSIFGTLLFNIQKGVCKQHQTDCQPNLFRQSNCARFVIHRSQAQSKHRNRVEAGEAPMENAVQGHGSHEEKRERKARIEAAASETTAVTHQQLATRYTQLAHNIALYH